MLVGEGQGIPMSVWPSKWFEFLTIKQKENENIEDELWNKLKKLNSEMWRTYTTISKYIYHNFHSCFLCFVVWIFYPLGHHLSSFCPSSFSTIKCLGNIYSRPIFSQKEKKNHISNMNNWLLQVQFHLAIDN